MALIKCTECGKDVSDKAAACPNCGNPITKQDDALAKSNICCPKCKSNELHAEQKGFSGGKAVAGAVLVGGIGLLAGTIGSKDVEITCLTCGNKFKAGEQNKIQSPIPSKIELNRFDKHVVKKEDAEKTQLYRCDCGKESCLLISHTICPKCGRRLNEAHKLKLNNSNKGCFGFVLIPLLLSMLLILFN